MQKTQSKSFRGGGKVVQSALQLLLSRVQSGISSAASVTHLSGRSMRDLEQIAHRGLPLTADDLVSLYAVTAHIDHTSYTRCVASIRRCRRQPPWYNQ